MLALANKIYLFHTITQFKQTKKGDLLYLILYAVPIGVLYFILDYFVHYLLDDFAEKKMLRLDKYLDPVIRKKKGIFIVKQFFHTGYYLISTITGCLLIKNTSLWPQLFGTRTYMIYQFRYLEQATSGMQLYYYVQFGKHISRFYSHVFIKPDGNYYQFLLHHALATFLIFFSYAMDMWVIGILVLILHDGPDIFLAIPRTYREFRNHKKIFLYITATIGLLIWIVVRIFMFGYYCVFHCWYGLIFYISNLSAIENQVFSLPYIYMTGMLSCLLIMHIFWSYYIIQFFIATSVSEKITKYTYD